MKNFGVCDPIVLQNDLKRLIVQHNEHEAQRRIEADTRLGNLQRELDEVTTFIAAEGGKP